MAITKRPVKPNPADIDAFISGAPDAAPATVPPTALPAEPPTETASAPKRVKKGKKVQITLTITEAMLERVDERAGQIGQSRAAWINLAIAQMLESGLKLDGVRSN